MRTMSNLLHSFSLAAIHFPAFEGIRGCAVGRDGRTIIPTRLYWNDKGLAKLELALAKGKTAPDKRHTEAERDWKREQGRLMRDRDFGDSALICQAWVAPLERGAEMSDDANNAELATQIQPSGHIRYGV